jgi:hypothetical protein
MRQLLLVAAGGLLAACTSRSPKAPAAELSARLPRDASRFSLVALSDSTVSFRPEEARWIVPSLRGIAVDPVQGDVLVARVVVTHMHGDSAIAMVTGQTTRVATGQVLLFVPPARRSWQQRAFWHGAALSSGVFAAVGILLLL